MVKSLVSLVAVMVGFCLIAALPSPAASQDTKAPGGYSWTGFYAGLNAGYSFSANNTDKLSPVSSNLFPAFTAGAVAQPGSLGQSGFIGGGQMGYNYQFKKHWLTGLEIDFQYTDIRDSSDRTSTIPPFANTNVHQNLSWLGTVRPRIGYIPTSRLLLYATGGPAWGRTNSSASIVDAVGEYFCGSSASMRTGWTAGAGLEWAFMNNFSLKAEYLYYDLGSDTVHVFTVVAVQPSLMVARVQTTGNILRVGFNYKF
jgi:outer membrane immunogenic protein